MDKENKNLVDNYFEEKAQKYAENKSFDYQDQEGNNYYDKQTYDLVYKAFLEGIRCALNSSFLASMKVASEGNKEN